MLKIGEFSRLSRVSVKMLRHYDEIGLLTPAHVDPFSNYRYYAADQLPRLNRIVALKDLGFGLDQIARLLEDGCSADEIRGMLMLKRAEIERQIAAEQARLLRIEERLRTIEREGSPPPYDVIVRPVAAQLVASIRLRAPLDGNAVTCAFERLEAYVARFAARAARPPLTLYHDEAYSDDVRDVEVVVPVEHSIEPSDEVQVRRLSGAPLMACVVHTGDYRTLDDAATLLLQWIDGNGFTIAGPLRELYVRFGADNNGYTLPNTVLAETVAQFVTELQLPVRVI